MAIEPLAIFIRQSEGIVGFRRSGREEKIALYADDALIFFGRYCRVLGGTHDTCIYLVSTFGQFSGFYINWEKSTLMPLHDAYISLPDQVAQIQIKHKFKYLGIEVAQRVRDYVALNLKPLLLKFRDKCRSWCKLPLTVIGRGNLIKMIWTPQLLYILHNSPIWITLFWFGKVESLFQGLIWWKKQSRIKLTSLMLAKDEGGLAIPHIKSYFLAAQI